MRELRLRLGTTLNITIGESIDGDTIAALGTRIEVTQFLGNRVSSLAPIDAANEPDDLPPPAEVTRSPA